MSIHPPQVFVRAGIISQFQAKYFRTLGKEIWSRVVFDENKYIYRPTFVINILYCVFFICHSDTQCTASNVYFHLLIVELGDSCPILLTATIKNVP